MKKVIRKIKAIDSFSKTPKLNYEGSNFKTYLGGIVTIFGVVSLVAYWIYIFNEMFTLNTMNMNIKSTVKDISKDDQSHHPIDNSFDYAFTIKQNDYSHFANLSDYFEDGRLTLKAYQIEIEAPNEVGSSQMEYYSMKEVELEQCIHNPRMKKRLNEVMKSAEDYFCIKDYDYEIKGNRYSEHRKYIQLEFRTCHWEYNNGERDTPWEQFSELYYNLTQQYFIEVVMVDSYFDDKNIDEPVAHYLTENYYYPIIWEGRTDIDIFIQENELELHDSYLPLAQPKEEKFYSVRGDKVISREIYPDGRNFSMYINIKLDQEMRVYQRTVFSLTDASSQIGGMAGFIHPILVILVAYFVDILFSYAILSKCYQVHRHNPSGKEFGYKPELVLPEDDPSHHLDPPNIRKDYMYDDEEDNKYEGGQAESNAKATKSTPGRSKDYQIEIEQPLRDSNNDKGKDKTLIQHVHDEMIHRKRFTWFSRDFWFNIFSLCKWNIFMPKNFKKRLDINKKLHNKGVDKLRSELNIVHLIKSMRKVEWLWDTLLSAKEKTLEKFSRHHIISIATNEEAIKEDRIVLSDQYKFPRYKRRKEDHHKNPEFIENISKFIEKCKDANLNESEKESMVEIANSRVIRQPKNDVFQKSWEIAIYKSWWILCR